MKIIFLFLQFFAIFISGSEAARTPVEDPYVKSPPLLVPEAGVSKIPSSQILDELPLDMGGLKEKNEFLNNLLEFIKEDYRSERKDMDSPKFISRKIQSIENDFWAALKISGKKNVRYSTIWLNTRRGIVAYFNIHKNENETLKEYLLNLFMKKEKEEVECAGTEVYDSDSDSDTDEGVDGARKKARVSKP